MTYQHEPEWRAPICVRSISEQEGEVGGLTLAAQAAEILDDIRWELGRDLESAAAAAIRLATLLAPKPAEPTAIPGGLALWQMRKVERFIRDRLDDRIRIEDMAQVVSLSTSYFSRAFKTSFGATPHAYILNLRVQLARRLMVTSDEPLSQIAQACGFADQSHLAKIFRCCTGQSPHAWRRSQLAGA